MTKKKRSQIMIRTIRSPYRSETAEPVDRAMKRYFDDPERIVRIDARQYYKIMELDEWRRDDGSKCMIALIDSSIGTRNGDTLIDENGSIFSCLGHTMLSWHHELYPECMNIADLLLEGDPEAIGAYIAVVGSISAHNEYGCD